jgi:ApbE superfamily uncharacterized protein (UPF0280 family)
MSVSCRAQFAVSPGGRLHMQDGPIDLIVQAFGEDGAVRNAYDAGCQRFSGLLELCAELSELRRQAEPLGTRLEGSVARRMFEAVKPFAGEHFITPMAAVAGSVAEEILAAMVYAGGGGLTKAYVNNGGDIALHLTPGSYFTAGLVDRPDRPSLFGTAKIGEASGIRGIATSGARGRSFSLGIADAVTVLARSASVADAAATIIANAVDLPDHPGIVRVPAMDLQPDNDLGELAVTRIVPPLTAAEIGCALTAGMAMAETCIKRDLIIAAALHLQGETRVAGLPLLTSHETGLHRRAKIRASISSQGFAAAHL